MTHQDLPVAYPQTASAMLLAQGGDPLAAAAARTHAARRAICELLDLLPPDQAELAAEFAAIVPVLDHALDWFSARQVPRQQVAALRRSTTGRWGEPLLHADVWVGNQPDDGGETVYGFRAAMPVLLDRLRQAVACLDEQVEPADGPRLVARAGSVAEFAARTESAVASFTAAVWEFERPTTAALPAGTTQVRLRCGPRTHPWTRWSRHAQVLFLPGRVEVTTSSGTHTIGDRRPIAHLVHVVPPSPRAVLVPYDPAERHDQLALQDELGVLHFCSEDGYSLGAIMVVDWLAQPEYQAAQDRLTSAGTASPAYDHLVWGLQASGITDGAAVLDLPIRRGVMHPPSAEPLPSPLPPNEAHYTMPPQIPLLRPAPHRQPYRGLAATASAALTRRRRRWHAWRNDTGPASPLNLPIRAGAPLAAWIGGLATAYLFAETLWARLGLLWAVVAVCEPWLWWAWLRVRDRSPQRPQATYRPGRHPAGTRAFATRARVVFDGTDIGVIGPQGHTAWAPGPREPRGVRQLHQLTDDDGAWAVAFVDAQGRWRFVLPAAQWVPGGDFAALAGFARAVGLPTAQTYARRMAPSSDAFEDHSPATRPGRFGPEGRGMLTLAFWCALVTPLTWWGWHVATAAMVALTAGAAVPVLIRSWWTWYQRRPT